MITIQFSTTNHISSKMIGFMTWSWASHTDFVLPDGTLFGALAMENGGGVRKHILTPSYTRIERYTVDAPESILDIALAQEGKPYDWGGIFGVLARNRNWEDDDKWFCSELVAYCFKKAGVPLINDEPYRITPRDLLVSPLLKRVDLTCPVNCPKNNL